MTPEALQGKSLNKQTLSEGCLQCHCLTFLVNEHCEPSTTRASPFKKKAFNDVPIPHSERRGACDLRSGRPMSRVPLHPRPLVGCAIRCVCTPILLWLKALGLKGSLLPSTLKPEVLFETIYFIKTYNLRLASLLLGASGWHPCAHRLHPALPPPVVGGLVLQGLGFKTICSHKINNVRLARSLLGASWGHHQAHRMPWASMAWFGNQIAR